MLVLHAYSEQINCDSAVRGTDYIESFVDGRSVRKDDGITDFSGYSLTNEDGTPDAFSKPQIDVITEMQLALAELYEEVLSRG